MGMRAVLAMGLLLAAFSGAAPAVVLHNEHLTATFAEPDAGPRLAEIRCESAGGTFRFAEDQAASLFVVPGEAVHDPNWPGTFAEANDFAMDGVDAGDDKTHARLRLQHDLVPIDVGYQLDPQAPVLRKTIVCKAKDKPVHVAGVQEWAMKPVNASLIWPKRGVLGPPAVLFADPSGYLLTLEELRAGRRCDSGPC